MFPNVSKIHIERSLQRLRDFGSSLQIAFYAPKKLFFSVSRVRSMGISAQKHTESEFGIFHNFGEIPKDWEIS